MFFEIIKYYASIRQCNLNDTINKLFINNFYNWSFHFINFYFLFLKEIQYYNNQEWDYKVLLTNCY
jgi:hypothetical protein